MVNIFLNLSIYNYHKIVTFINTKITLKLTLIGVKMNIICKDCGMIYVASEIPKELVCLCKGKEFKVSKEIENVNKVS